MDLAGASVNTVDRSVRALQNQVSELQRRVQELELEKKDLCSICMANGIQYEELLSAQRHRRYFKQLCSDVFVKQQLTSVLDTLKA